MLRKIKKTRGFANLNWFSLRKKCQKLARDMYWLIDSSSCVETSKYFFLNGVVFPPNRSVYLCNCFILPLKRPFLQAQFRAAFTGIHWRKLQKIFERSVSIPDEEEEVESLDDGWACFDFLLFFFLAAAFFFCFFLAFSFGFSSSSESSPELDSCNWTVGFFYLSKEKIQGGPWKELKEFFQKLKLNSRICLLKTSFILNLSRLDQFE